MARPTTYDEKIAAEICTWIAGGKSLRAFCRQDGTPALSTVCLWIVTHDEFSEQYMRAREAAGYAHADGIVEMTELVRDGHINANDAKAIMDGLKWAAERMSPKRHSPKQSIDHQSSDGSMTPREVQRVIIDTSNPDS